MQLERDIADGVHRVEDAYVNWYLVEDGDALTVVDAGHPASWKSLQRVLSELGRHPGQIEALVLTHGHFDHVGFARRLREDHAVTVYAPAGERQLVAHPWEYDHEHSRTRQLLRHPGFGKVFATMGAAGALIVKGTEVDVPYAAEGPLDVPGRPRPVPTPGHTHDHHALVLAERGIVLAGDAFVTFNPYTTGSGPQIVSGAATADSALALASLEQLAAFEGAAFATGHGPVWRGSAAEAVERARAAGRS